ncbi:amino acid adenylation domain-containing protein (plasmid) [Enterobacteriaceae bacterium Kacie_13]|nr:amino acid adenylation domain-containing protein [Enterobacteriaceae bacterium Kacie_13]
MPLVAAQPGIWMADQLSPHGNAYTVAHYIEIDGALDVDAMLQAIVQGLNEADTLTMRFEERDGIALQTPCAQSPAFAPECIDLRQSADPEQAALNLMRQDLAQERRILSGKMLHRHVLMRICDARWFWYQRYHHIQVDGFSFTAIARRIAQLYTAISQGRTPVISPFTPFRDVIEEYAHYQQSPAFTRDAAFWREKAKTLPAPATVCPQPLAGQVPSVRLHRLSCTCEAGPIAALVALETAQQLTASDIAIALLALWVSRLSGQTAFCGGFIFMRRIGSAALCATGPVINVLPVAMHVNPDATLTELAVSLRHELKTVRRHQRYDAEQISRDLGLAGDVQPLYGTVFNFKMFDYHLDFNGVAGITHDLVSGPVRDLEISLHIGEDGALTVDLLANAERYDRDELHAHLQRLPALLRQFAQDATLKVGAADLLSEADHKLLERVNATGRDVVKSTLSQQLAQQAERTPHAPALADQHHQFSYTQTRQQVAALAQQLIQQGVKRGDIVAVALPRSVFLSLALMAIVEVGAAYLPLDTGYPDERLRMMLEDASPRLVVTHPDQLARFSSQGQVLLVERPLELSTPVFAVNAPTPEHAAYLIFTSGSTGRPKGVVVGHQAIVNRLLWMQDHYPIGNQDVVLQKTPCSFDVSVWEFFWPLMVGARLVMAPPDAHRDPQQLLSLIEQHQVTTLHFVPSMLAAFVSALDTPQAIAQCASLRQVFCSGEALPAELCRLWQHKTGVPLHNLYGPTEAAVDVSWHPAWGDALAAVKGANVPIGLPVWNTGMRILDARLQPVPPGVAGDLYLTGDQLAHGYLGRPDLTASRFVADPFGQGGRMYRTGDVARWLPDGAVEYLGRSDDQLKIRGQRIELSEIDHALLSLPGVQQAVTKAMTLGAVQSDATGGDARQLVGYLVAQSGVTLDGESLRAVLAERLPAHMVPVVLITLKALPLSANGKLDRKALPQPQSAATVQGREPLPGLESDIAALFGRLLQCEQVFADDDFFALGGHSLLAMRLAADLRRELGKPVSVGQVMVASSVEKLAHLLAENHSQEEADRSGFDALLPLRTGQGPTLFCLHPASGFAWQFSVLPRYLDEHWSVMGIQSPHPEGPLAVCQNMEQVCDAHLQTVLSVQPHGPYHFIGYSLGGTLAQGLAARLQARGEEVAFLGLLDTYPPETQSWDTKPDDDVLQEIQRERLQFRAASEETLNSEQTAARQTMFDHIEANYADSVRLLSATKTARFNGQATLFVASQTLPQGMDVQKTWADYVDELQVHTLDCAHVDIVSPSSFKTLGPMLNRILRTLTV